MTKQTEAIQIAAVMTLEQENEFLELETEALQIHDSFLKNARRFGQILEIIKKKGYFKMQRNNPNGISYKDFDSYLKAKFHKGRAVMFNYEKATQLMNWLEKNGFDPYELRTINNAMIMYKEIRNFFPKEFNPKEVENLSKQLTLNAWRLIIGTSTRDNDGGLLIDQEHIEAVFKHMKDVVYSDSVIVDGKSVGLTHAMAFDAEVTSIVAERIQTQKDVIRQEKQTRKAKMFQEKPSHLQSIEHVMFRDQWKMQCPVHGETSGLCLTNSGFKAVCGCFGSLEVTQEGNAGFYWYQEQPL